jgi:endonuclease YncB( thermonuclease family)
MGGRVRAWALGGWLCAGAALVLASCAPEAARQATEAPAEADAGIAAEIVGYATVRDGRTISVGTRRVRFDGIVTPREGTMCEDTNVHRAAANALRQITRAHEVRCRISNLPDTQGRDIATCTADEIDLNAHMVANGWARGSHGGYASEEASARAAELGVWRLGCATDIWVSAESAD